MYAKLFALLLSYLLVYATSARPVIHEAAKDDVVAVGSFIREVRQLAPLKIAAEVGDLTSAGKSDEGGYYRTYGSDAEGEKGYLKETYGKGDQGYKTLDTFHKRDGDKYEFETQTTYGKKHDDNNNEKHHEGKKEESDHEGAGTMVDKEYAGGEEDHEGEGSEYSHYTEDDDSDAYGSYHEEKEPESKSYSHNENYSDGDGNEESYEGHSSYNSGDDGEEDDHN